MSWHYLQGQEAAFWEGSCLDGAPSALLSMIHTQEPSCSQGKPTDALTDSQSGTMCGPSTENNGGAASMSSAVDSRAKTLASQTAELRDSKENGLDCGMKCGESFTMYDPDLRLWKTAQLSLFGGSEPFSETWPRWGMMQGGACFRLPMLEHNTSANASGSWPTPTKWEEKYIHSKSPGDHYHGIGWILWNQRNLQPTPQCYEALMGWPIGWTALRGAETADPGRVRHSG